MILNDSAFLNHLKKKLSAIYILSGEDQYLQVHYANMLKKAFHAEDETRKLILEQPKDWDTLLEEAQSYSLFTEKICVEAWLDKKTLEAHGKNTLQRYLLSTNSRALILVHAPQIPFKQWQFLEKQEEALILKLKPLTGTAYRHWITDQLKGYQLSCDQQGLEILQQYTEGNPLACIRTLEKLSLISEENQTLDANTVAKHTMDQAQWQIFDLSEACLAGNARKALNLLKQAAAAKIEPTLVLWVLTQEIRLLLRLNFLLKKGTSFREACTELKIWNTRFSLYQNMQNRLPPSICENLLTHCYTMDTWIKTGKLLLVWQGLESLALTLCLGEPVT